MIEIKNITLIGAGGHAKVVIASLLHLEKNPHICCAVYDDDSEKIGRVFFDDIIIEDRAKLSSSENVHVAIGHNALRARLSHQHTKDIDYLLSIQHPTALVDKTARFNGGCFFAAYSIVAPHTYLGHGIIINHGAIVDHDCKIGSWSHIAPNATLGGNVHIGENVLVGTSAVILPGISIGNNSIVGAGAIVIKNIPSNTTVVGNPAK